MDQDTPKRVLLVDESEAGRYAVARILSRAGFIVLEADSGGKALELAERERVDLVLLDISLPDMSGYDVCKRIKAHPATASIPVVHLSASYVRLDERVSGLEGGADGYVVQPVDPRELVATVRAYLRLKETDRALRESEERFRGIFEHSPVGMGIIAPDGRLLLANRALCDMLGFEESELLQKSLLDLTHPDDQGLNRDRIHRLISGEIPVLQMEIRGMKRDGGTVWGFVHGSVVRDRNGNPLFVVGQVLDISKRKADEERIRHLNRVLRAIRGIDQLITRERDPRILLEKACQLLVETRGYSSAVIILTDRAGAPVSHVQAGLERSFPALAASLEEDRPPPCCDARPRSDGRPLLVDRSRTCPLCPLVSECPGMERMSMTLHHERNHYGLLSVSLAGSAVNDPEEQSLFAELAGDLAFALYHIEREEEARVAEERRQLAEAQLRQAQKMEAIGTLAGGIAHDFNNILGIIMGFAEMADWEASPGSPLKRQLREVLQAAERAKNLVQQILAFSRQGELERKPIQVGPIIKETLQMLRAAIPSTIKIEAGVSSKATVMGDPTQIHQVLMNLCTNAAYAMREQGGVLRVEAEDIQGPALDASRELHPCQTRPHVLISVSDTGHGIDPDIQDRIFDPFFTTKGKGVGTGLGLAVVHGIVGSHGGAIEVSSKPGEGTSFRVFLPIIVQSPVHREIDQGDLPSGKERILVVDDEPILGRALKGMLDRLGYEVSVETDSQKALQLFRSQQGINPFALVLTDMTMPEMTGLRLARELLRLEPDLPVILCTGYSEWINAEQAADFGIRGFLMKPVAIRDLAQMVRNLLDKGKASWPT